jgi:Cu(I)/Ag(I) efflux system membrane protein CusA/SilA
MSDREDNAPPPDELRTPLGRLIGLFLHNKLIVLVAVGLLVAAALAVAPFGWGFGEAAGIDPVPVDAIPNLGENQQIIFAEWPGRSPQDVEDQLTYPLTSALLGLRKVKAVRGNSMFGFSSVHVIFEEGVDFYESRTRLLEKLSSLRGGRDYPEGVRPQLGPEATALGQVFWYTLEGRDARGRLTGGWDLEELRAVQDWYVRHALLSAEGVAEVASVGGYVREYQVNLDPAAMRHFDVSLDDVRRAVRRSNLDVGAGTVEINRVEYFVRGVGFLENVEDLRRAAVKTTDGVPVLLEQVAEVTTGPAPRRGALDRDGAEAVGGVVVARFDANPMQVIEAVKDRIERIEPGMARKVVLDRERAGPDAPRAYARRHGFEAYVDGRLNQSAWLAHLEGLAPDQRPEWARLSKVTIVPFYDRSELIAETLGTLERALRDQMLLTFLVVVILLLHLRSSLLIGSMLPLAVGLTFVAMRLVGVDANIVALSGIAIAIGTIVDMGIVLCENILRHLDEAPPGGSRLAVVHRGATEVGGAILTAAMTTVIGFLPVFALTGRAGKLFRPLAFTKTFALVASAVIALTVLPSAAWLLLRGRRGRRADLWRRLFRFGRIALIVVTVIVAVVVLTRGWMPLGPGSWRMFGGLARNLVFTVGIIAFFLVLFRLFQWAYPAILGWCLRHKVAFLAIPSALVVMALLAWLGLDRLAGAGAGRAADDPPERPAHVLEGTNLWVIGTRTFPGLQREFMPELDEGQFLWMPVLSVHGSIGEALDILAKQDRAIRAIPEVETVVGKIGRADSPLDPAPVSMIETLISYKPEHRWKDGRWVRQWRDHIHSPDDIWEEIVRAAKVPGANIASKDYPISIRQTMLQTGMTGQMGVKVTAGSLGELAAAADAVGEALAESPVVREGTINVQRVEGKPYLVVDVTTPAAREAMQRYRLNPVDVLETVQAAVGGRVITTTVDGRRRFAVRVRYQRELRDRVEAMERILIDAPAARPSSSKSGRQVPLADLATVVPERGPQSIKSENTFKVAYVTFGAVEGVTEVEAAEQVERFLDARVRAGRLELPPGAEYRLEGSFRNERQANRRLRVIVPISLAVILLLLYLQFRRLSTAVLIFTGIGVAFAGGFLLLWLYGQPWFLDVTVLGADLRDVFGVDTIHLSTAIWVGFLALFGIATDDGVVMSTYLEQTFRRRGPRDRDQVRAAVVAAGSRRVRA